MIKSTVSADISSQLAFSSSRNHNDQMLKTNVPQMQ